MYSEWQCLQREGRNTGYVANRKPNKDVNNTVPNLNLGWLKMRTGVVEKNSQMLSGHKRQQTTRAAIHWFDNTKKKEKKSIWNCPLWRRDVECELRRAWPCRDRIRPWGDRYAENRDYILPHVHVGHSNISHQICTWAKGIVFPYIRYERLDFRSVCRRPSTPPLAAQPTPVSAGIGSQWLMLIF